jgi:hypothetical protein
MRYLVWITITLVSFNVSIALAQMGRLVDVENEGTWSSHPLLMVNVPDGSGTPFNNCYLRDTYQRDTSNITVHITFADDYPGDVGVISNINWELRLYPIGSSTVHNCGDDSESYIYYIGPFSNTISSSGIYHIDLALYLGGSGTYTASLVYIATSQEFTLGEVTFISPDISGDGLVNLSDNVMFTQILNSSTYDIRADFAYSGAINLGDAVIMTGASGATCP